MTARLTGTNRSPEQKALGFLGAASSAYYQAWFHLPAGHPLRDDVRVLWDATLELVRKCEGVEA